MWPFKSKPSKLCPSPTDPLIRLPLTSQVLPSLLIQTSTSPPPDPSLNRSVSEEAACNASFTPYTVLEADQYRSSNDPSFPRTSRKRYGARNIGFLGGISGAHGGAGHAGVRHHHHGGGHHHGAGGHHHGGGGGITGGCGGGGGGGGGDGGS